MEIFTHIAPFLKTILIAAYAISILVVIILIMLENRSPLKAISWILVLMLLPGLGIIFYVFFGQNLRKEKIIARKGLKNHDLLSSIAHSQNHKLSEGNLIESPEVDGNLRLVQMLLNNSSSIITVGNKVKVLNNGKETFDCIKQALKEAEKFIHLEYYIIDNDTIGNEIIDILKEKCQSGVEVRIIVDDVGSWELKRSFFRDLESYGIEIKSFLQVRFPLFTSKVNYRNHRKIIVIDGEIGFLGGINIADRYLKGDSKYGIWRDMHLQIDGDAVNAIQTVFLTDWYFVSQKDIADPYYFPVKQPDGDKMVQITASGPDSDYPGIMMGFFQAIASATKYVYIATPYFMPSEGVLLAITAAALGGIDIRILVPEKSDAYFTQLCTKSYIREMLEAGVKFYFYQKGFLHSKMMVVDDQVCTIGTTNMDFRSFEQNFEVNAFIFDAETAIEVRDIYLNDLKDSRMIVLKEWKKRPRWQKAKESFARLFSPLL